MTHVANAFKYATGIIVVFASTNKRSGGSSVLFWASVLLNSLYSFYWDVRMDWGLFTSTTTIIRENRRYDKIWYYVAVALDFVLRISWSLKLSASYGLLFDGEYVVFIISLKYDDKCYDMRTQVLISFVSSFGIVSPNNVDMYSSGVRLVSLSFSVTSNAFQRQQQKMKQIRGRSYEGL